MRAPLIFGPPPRSEERIPPWTRACFVLFCADVAFVLAYTWWLGAFLPTVLWTLAVAGGLLLFIVSLAAAVGLPRRQTWRRGALLAVLTLALGVAGSSCVPALRRMAARRDVGAPARQWAQHLLAEPRSQVLDPSTGDGLEPQVRSELIPAFEARQLPGRPDRAARCARRRALRAAHLRWRPSWRLRLLSGITVSADPDRRQR